MPVTAPSVRRSISTSPPAKPRNIVIHYIKQPAKKMVGCFIVLLCLTETNCCESVYKPSHSLSHRVLQASLGMRQSPRGERLMLPTLGPSGRQLRLNCCEKKRRQKV